MIKSSLLLMAVLTVLCAVGLRWRERRSAEVAQASAAAASRGKAAAARRPGLFARGKAGLDRWVTAAAIAAVVTILIMGGLHWIRVYAG